MSMLKTSFIVCGLLFCLLPKIHGSSDSKAYSLTKQWAANYTYSPKVVKVNDNILVVGLQNNTVIVNSTFSGKQSNVCKLDFLQPDDLVGSKIYVYALGNGRIVINTVVIKRNEKTSSEPPSGPPFWRLLLIMYPFDCSSLAKVELRRSGNEEFQALVPYYDSFDVFYHREPSAENKAEALKSPQRYNYRGEQLDLMNNYIGSEDQILVKNIQTFQPYNATQGFVAYLGTDKGEVLRILDYQFKTVSEVNVDDIDIRALTPGPDQSATYCYSTTKPYNNSEHTKEAGSEHVVCVILNNGLVHLRTSELEKPAGPDRVYNIELAHIPNAGFLVTVTYRYYPREIDGFPTKVYAHHIENDGRIWKPVEMFARSMFYHELSQTITFDNGEACIVNGGEMEHYKPFQNVRNSIWIDCVQIWNR